MNTPASGLTKILSGRSVLITGTSGIGLHTAIALADAGADVTMAGRNASRGADAVAQVRVAVADAAISFESVDLAELASIRAFGKRLREQRTSLDVLINNAGVMATPQRTLTADGFELQLATNYLGPFTLTRELLPLLRAGLDPRVVTVSSFASNNGRIDLADLQSKMSYRPMTAYAQTKLADLMFAFELQRRSDAHGWGLTSIAVHPGLSRTELAAKGAGARSLPARAAKLAMRLFGQSASQGALPSVFAATSPDAKGGCYYGPDGFRELTGGPAPAKVPARAKDANSAARLWDLSQHLTTHPESLTWGQPAPLRADDPS